MSRRSARIKLTTFVIAIGAMVYAAGCAIKPIVPVNHTAAVTQPIGSATTQLSAESAAHGQAHGALVLAHQEVAAVIKTPNVPPPAVQHAQAADQHVSDADKAVAVAEGNNRTAITLLSVANEKAEALGKEDFELQQKLQAAQVRINKLESQWLSPRQERELWLIGISIGLYAFALGMMKEFGGAYPALLGAYHLLLIPITGGFNLLHALGVGAGKMLAWIKNKIVAARAAAAAAAKTAVANATAPKPAAA